MTSLRERNEADLQLYPVQAFLNAIATAEGTDAYGYRTAFGGGQLKSLDDHPRTYKAFRETTGKRNKTSAAGRYQIIGTTWDDVAAKNKSQDFSAHEQDLGAVQLLRESGALAALKAGNLGEATRLAGTRWAALPTSTAPQKKLTNTAWANLLAKNMTPEFLNQVPQALNPLPSLTQAQFPEPKALTVVPPKVEPLSAAAVTTPSWQADFANAVADAQATEPDVTEADRQIEDWQNDLLYKGLALEADADRQAAVDSFLGENPVKRYSLPPEIEKAILRALS